MLVQGNANVGKTGDRSQGAGGPPSGNPLAIALAGLTVTLAGLGAAHELPADEPNPITIPPVVSPSDLPSDGEIAAAQAREAQRLQAITTRVAAVRESFASRLEAPLTIREYTKFWDAMAEAVGVPKDVIRNSQNPSDLAKAMADRGAHLLMDRETVGSRDERRYRVSGAVIVLDPRPSTDLEGRTQWCSQGPNYELPVFGPRDRGSLGHVASSKTDSVLFADGEIIPGAGPRKDPFQDDLDTIAATMAQHGYHPFRSPHGKYYFTFGNESEGGPKGTHYVLGDGVYRQSVPRTVDGTPRDPADVGADIQLPYLPFARRDISGRYFVAYINTNGQVAITPMKPRPQVSGE